MSKAVSPTKIKKASERAIKASKPGAALVTSRKRPCVSLSACCKRATASDKAAGLSSKSLVRYEIKEPGFCNSVSAKVSAPIRTRGPKPPKLTVLSGSVTNVPATISVASPSRTSSPMASFKLRIREGCSNTCPVASPSCRLSGPSMTASPTKGQAASTAFNSTNLRSSPARNIARISTLLLSCPRVSAMRMTLSSTAVCRDEISISPPNKMRPLPSMPERIDSATEPTAPMAATPKTSAERKIRNLDKLPFISRRARRQARDQLISPDWGVVICVIKRLPCLNHVIFYDLAIFDGQDALALLGKCHIMCDEDKRGIYRLCCLKKCFNHLRPCFGIKIACWLIRQQN